MKIGITGNISKERTRLAMKKVPEAAARHGVELYADADTVNLLGCGTVCPVEEMGGAADAVVAFGGDGLMLRAFGSLGDCGLPVAGINTGTLGYMTCGAADRIDDVFAALVSGSYEVDERIMLAGEINGLPGVCHALNDIVITRGNSGRVMSLDVEIDGRKVNTYRCDGIIIATPTGSTAYSLSAGGPIIVSDARALILNVICPHTLSSRPLILPDTADITISVMKASAPALVTADGRDCAEMEADGMLRIRRSRRTAKIIFLKDHDEFGVLRGKLGWYGSTRPDAVPEDGGAEQDRV